MVILLFRYQYYRESYTSVPVSLFAIVSKKTSSPIKKTIAQQLQDTLFNFLDLLASSFFDQISVQYL